MGQNFRPSVNMSCKDQDSRSSIILNWGRPHTPLVPLERAFVTGFCSCFLSQLRQNDDFHVSAWSYFQVMLGYKAYHHTYVETHVERSKTRTPLHLLKLQSTTPDNRTWDSSNYRWFTPMQCALANECTFSNVSLHLAFLSGLVLHLDYIHCKMWNPP